MYRRLPYGLRYLVAIVLWAGIVAGDLFCRFAFVFLIPFIAIRPPSQEKAQLLANVADFMIRPVMRPPLLRRSRRSTANRRPKLIQ